MKKCIKCVIDEDGMISEILDGDGKFNDNNFKPVGVLSHLNDDSKPTIDFTVDESEFYDENGNEIFGDYNVYILVDEDEFHEIINKGNTEKFIHMTTCFTS